MHADALCRVGYHVGYHVGFPVGYRVSIELPCFFKHEENISCLNAALPIKSSARSLEIVVKKNGKYFFISPVGF